MDLGPMQLIIEYRYWILLPLSFAEGPLVAFFAGTLAAAGYFNIWMLAAFFFARDVIVDLCCYYLGYYGGQSRWIHRVLRRFGITDEHLEEVRVLWNKHPGKTMFLSKLSYGVAAGFIVVAGLVRMSLKQFLLYGSIIALMHYGVLLFLGYFFGASFGGSIIGIIENIPYVVGALSLLAIGYYFFKRRIGKKLQDEERAARAEIVSK
ncbi:MAG: VTT domain-containing protein [Patescibacteria group bacterium]